MNKSYTMVLTNSKLGREGQSSLMRLVPIGKLGIGVAAYRRLVVCGRLASVTRNTAFNSSRQFTQFQITGGVGSTSITHGQNNIQKLLCLI